MKYKNKRVNNTRIFKTLKHVDRKERSIYILIKHGSINSYKVKP